MNGRWGARNLQHIYICAHSIADACRICEQLTGRNAASWRNEINVYFSKGCWGNAMEDVTPERGAWVQDYAGTEKPKRIL